MTLQLTTQATTERDAIKTMRDLATQAHQQASQDVVAARAALDAATKAYADDEQQLADYREQMAEATPPDASNILTTNIEPAIQTLRSDQAAIIARRDDLLFAEGALAAADAEVARTGALLLAAEARLVAVTALDEEHQRWLDAIAAAELTQLPTDAKNAVTDTAAPANSYHEALARYDALPPDLRGAIEARYARERGALAIRRNAADHVADAIKTTLDGDGGLDAKIAKARIDYDRAEAALRDYVTTARQLYEQACAQLDATAATPLLSDAELAGVTSDAFAGAGARAASAAKTEALRDADDKGIATTQSKIDDEIVSQTATHLTSTPAQVEALADVQTLIAQRTSSEHDRDTQHALTDDDWKALADWATLIPDDAWTRIAAFLDAEATLTDLGAPTDDRNPQKIGTDFTDADTALAAALAAAADNARQLEYLADQRDRRAAEYLATLNTRPTRILSAVRGDR